MLSFELKHIFVIIPRKLYLKSKNFCKMHFRPIYNTIYKNWATVPFNQKLNNNKLDKIQLTAKDWMFDNII